MPRPTLQQARARTSRMIDSLFNFAMIMDNFAPASIDGSKLTGLANIVAGAGVIPIVNLPPGAGSSYFTVSGAGALIGNDFTGDPRGAYALDISTKRGGVAAAVASGANAILVTTNIGRAVGANSIVIGSGASAYGSGAIAMGMGATIQHVNSGSSVVIGVNAQAGNSNYYAGNSVAIGAGALVNNSAANVLGSIAIGQDAIVQRNCSIAIGRVSYNYAPYATAVGYYTRITFPSNHALALGDNSKIGYGPYGASESVAIGNGATAWNTTKSIQSAIAIGTGAHANEDQSLAVGNSSIANTAYSIAVGKGAHVYGLNSIAIGRSAVSGAAGYNSVNSIAIGFQAINMPPVLGMNYNSVALGTNARTLGDRCLSVGYNSYAAGYQAVAIGPGVSTPSANTLQIGIGTDVLKIEVGGLVTVPNLRVNQVPALGAPPAATHTFTMSFNGDDFQLALYKVP